MSGNALLVHYEELRPMLFLRVLYECATIGRRSIDSPFVRCSFDACSTQGSVFDGMHVRRQFGACPIPWLDARAMLALSARRRAFKVRAMHWRCFLYA